MIIAHKKSVAHLGDAHHGVQQNLVVVGLLKSFPSSCTHHPGHLVLTAFRIFDKSEDIGLGPSPFGLTCNIGLDEKA